MTIGETIKALRKDNGLYQEELAKKIGVSRQTVASWEMDRTIPNMEAAVAMAKVFQCEVEALTGDDIDQRMKANNDQEFLFLENFRKADSETKKMVMRLLTYNKIAEGMKDEDPKT